MHMKNELITHLSSYGFNKSIISAFKSVKRERFLPVIFRKLAYEDSSLPIGYGQTIAQPYTIAFMLSLLEIHPGQKILEVGSGSGYVVALLSKMVDTGRIYGVEIIPELVIKSKKNLRELNNVEIRQATKQLGLPVEAPFDRILVSATDKSLPEELLDQLSDNGIMVCPVGNSILKVVLKNRKPHRESYDEFVFVPLVRF